MCLHPCGRKEKQIIAVKRIIHRHDIRPALACTTEMPEALSLEQFVHFRRRYVFNFQHDGMITRFLAGTNRSSLNKQAGRHRRRLLMWAALQVKGAKVTGLDRPRRGRNESAPRFSWVRNRSIKLEPANREREIRVRTRAVVDQPSELLIDPIALPLLVLTIPALKRWAVVKPPLGGGTSVRPNRKATG